MRFTGKWGVWVWHFNGPDVWDFGLGYPGVSDWHDGRLSVLVYTYKPLYSLSVLLDCLCEAF